MDKQTWVALDKGLAVTFKDIRRKYSEIEAMFSYSLDVNCGKERSLRDYSRMWSWDRGTVKRFVEKIKAPPMHHQRTTKAPPYKLILLGIDNREHHKSTTNAPPTHHKYKEQEQEQETTKKHIDNFRPDFIPLPLWKELISNRKFKKLQNTELALKTFTNSLQKGVDAGHSIETCVGEYVSTKWTRFNHEWIKKEGGNGKFKPRNRKEEHDDIREQWAKDLLAERYGERIPGSGSNEKLGN